MLAGEQTHINKCWSGANTNRFEMACCKDKAYRNVCGGGVHPGRGNSGSPPEEQNKRFSPLREQNSIKRLLMAGGEHSHCVKNELIL